MTNSQPFLRIGHSRFGSISEEVPYHISQSLSPSLTCIFGYIRLCWVTRKEVLPATIPNDQPVGQETMTTGFFSPCTFQEPKWNYYTCSKSFLSRDPAILDINVGKLSGGELTKSVTLSITQLEWEEHLTRSTLVALSWTAVCQEAVFAYAGDSPHGDIDWPRTGRCFTVLQRKCSTLCRWTVLRWQIRWCADVTCSGFDKWTITNLWFCDRARSRSEQ